MSPFEIRKRPWDAASGCTPHILVVVEGIKISRADFDQMMALVDKFSNETAKGRFFWVQFYDRPPHGYKECYLLSELSRRRLLDFHGMF